MELYFFELYVNMIRMYNNNSTLRNKRKPININDFYRIICDKKADRVFLDSIILLIEQLNIKSNSIDKLLLDLKVMKEKADLEYHHALNKYYEEIVNQARSEITSDTKIELELPSSEEFYCDEIIGFKLISVLEYDEDINQQNNQGKGYVLFYGVENQIHRVERINSRTKDVDKFFKKLSNEKDIIILSNNQKNIIDEPNIVNDLNQDPSEEKVVEVEKALEDNVENSYLKADSIDCFFNYLLLREKTLLSEYEFSFDFLKFVVSIYNFMKKEYGEAEFFDKMFQSLIEEYLNSDINLIQLINNTYYELKELKINPRQVFRDQMNKVSETTQDYIANIVLKKKLLNSTNIFSGKSYYYSNEEDNNFKQFLRSEYLYGFKKNNSFKSDDKSSWAMMESKIELFIGDGDEGYQGLTYMYTILKKIAQTFNDRIDENSLISLLNEQISLYLSGNDSIWAIVNDFNNKLSFLLSIFSREFMFKDKINEIYYFAQKTMSSNYQFKLEKNNVEANYQAETFHEKQIKDRILDLIETNIQVSELFSNVNNKEKI